MHPFHPWHLMVNRNDLPGTKTSCTRHLTWLNYFCLQGFGWLTPTVGALEFMQCVTQALSINARKSMQQSQKVCLTWLSSTPSAQMTACMHGHPSCVYIEGVGMVPKLCYHSILVCGLRAQEGSACSLTSTMTHICQVPWAEEEKRMQMTHKAIVVAGRGAEHTVAAAVGGCGCDQEGQPQGRRAQRGRAHGHGRAGATGVAGDLR